MRYFKGYRNYAFEAGKLAARNGQPKSTNPYQEGSRASFQWNAAYDESVRDIKLEKAQAALKKIPLADHNAFFNQIEVVVALKGESK